MKILSCFKMTPIWEKVLEDDWKNFTLQTNLRYAGKEINCFDESALELALRQKSALQEQGQISSCTALTAGEVPPVYAQMLLAAGFDDVIAIDTGKIEFAPATAAAALAEYTARYKPDLILCGQMAGMADTGLVPLLLAEELSLPILQEALDIKPCVGGVAVYTQEPDGIWERRVRPPLIVAVGNSPATLRAVSLRARAAFKSRQANRVPVTTAQPGMKELQLSRPVSGRVCNFITDDTETLAKLLLKQGLKSSAGPTRPATQNVTLPPAAITYDLANIPWYDTESAVRKIVSAWQKPDYLLLQDTSTGRRLAAGLAAATGSFLLTGAFFTEKGRVGKRVCASNLTWIQQTPLPAILTMAQLPVTTESITLAAENSPPPSWLIGEKKIASFSGKGLDNPRLVIVCGAGIGSRENCNQARALAKNLKAGFGLTRIAVSSGWGSPDELVGQSGLTISPQVCLILGASGASAFLVGIENAGTIIAVNTDQNALIFKHADIGLTASAPSLVSTLQIKLSGGRGFDN